MSYEHRRHFIDKNLLYLFSFDVNIEDTREEIGFGADGLRFNIFARDQDSRVFHALGEPTVNGDQTLAGTIVWGVDFARLREDDVAVLDVRLMIETDASPPEVVLTSYRGLFSVGPRGFRRLVSETPKLGSEQQPFEAKLFVGPRFETGAARFKWLERYHCIGFGRSQLINSLVRRASYDIYGMD